MNTIEKTQLNHKTINEASEKCVKRMRVWRDDYAIGQGKDQGDLLLWVSDADISSMERVEASGDFKLVPGGTQGSRHVISAHDVEIYKPTNFGQFVNSGTRDKPAGYIAGYVLKVLKRTELKHPEHPWHELPCGVIQTAQQVDARTLQRVKD